MVLPHFTQSPLDPIFVQDPYPFYDQVRAAGPLFHWDEYDKPCAAGFSTVDAILRDRRFGREAPHHVRPKIAPHLIPFYEIEANSMLEREPPTHTRLRSKVLRAFTARRIAALEEEITTLAHELIDAFPSGPFDLLPSFAERLPVTIIARMLGVPETSCDDLLAWSHAMVGMYQARRDRKVEDRAVMAAIAFSDFIRAEIVDRRNRPKHDLLSALVQDAEGLSEEEIISTAILLLNAGHEATVHTIGNGVKALLSQPNRSDMLTTTAIRQTTEEILRHDPPLHMFTRYALEGVEIAGHQFNAGDEVALLLAAANRDPDRWDHPDVFDPTRPIQTHTALGAGIHFCLGAPLARAELDIALPVLFSRCPKISLTEPTRYADVYHFHGLTGLMIEAP